MAFFSSSVTLGPTYNEFRYNEHLTITTRFLCIKNINNIAKRFGYTTSSFFCTFVLAVSGTGPSVYFIHKA